MEFDAQKMDEAADKAKAEFDKLSQHVTVPMARWWFNNYMAAGHKRLGRIMVAHAKAMKNSTEKNWTTEEDMKELEK
jgi:hypothetical protein